MTTGRKLVIGVDVDDVTLDLCGTLVARYNSTRLEADRISVEQITSWEIRECLPSHVADALYKDMRNDWLYQRAAAVPGAVRVISRLREVGHRVVFVSSCFPGMETNKIDRLVRVGLLPESALHDPHPDWFPARDKSLLAGSLDLLVDDGAHNVAKWGAKGILFDRPHNRNVGNCPGARRAKNWDEVYDLVQATALETNVAVRVAADAAPLVDAIAAASEALNTTSKPTNPKDIIGSGKLPLALFPFIAIAYGCLGFLNGLLKYGRDNFRVIGIRASIYTDAALRHLMAWYEGEECDPDDGVPHLAAALACIAIILDARAAGKMNDDRKVAGGFHAAMKDLAPHVARLKALHADKSPKHYNIQDSKEAA